MAERACDKVCHGREHVLRACFEPLFLQHRYELIRSLKRIDGLIQVPICVACSGDETTHNWYDDTVVCALKQPR